LAGSTIDHQMLAGKSGRYRVLIQAY